MEKAGENPVLVPKRFGWGDFFDPSAVLADFLDERSDDPSRARDVC